MVVIVTGDKEVCAFLTLIYNHHLIRNILGAQDAAQVAVLLLQLLHGRLERRHRLPRPLQPALHLFDPPLALRV